jgi:ATPase subunit of ABC transporter with duplicated ATPase domains
MGYFAQRAMDLLDDPPNFLVLDEPTNHLDIATKEMLIGALTAYEGTMLFVSHDRNFLAGCLIGCWS